MHYQSHKFLVSYQSLIPTSKQLKQSICLKLEKKHVSPLKFVLNLNN